MAASRGPHGETTAAVAGLMAAGVGVAETARVLGVTKSTVCYHARKLGIPPDERVKRRYDWAVVQRFYDEGHSITECERHFGMARKTFWDAVCRGEIVTRPQAMPLERLLTGKRSRHHVKMRLLQLGLKDNRCEDCGLTDWRGRPLSMALHHVNGDGADNRLENLRMLCPNCHSQTPNFGGRKRPAAPVPEGLERRQVRALVGQR